MLEINALVIRRGQWQQNYQLSVPEGTLLTIQGRSGAGKSALLAAIAGFESVASGDIRWQGHSLLSLPVEQRPVSMLFQAHNLFEHISVLRNLQLGLVFANPPARRRAIEVAAEALEIQAYLGKMPAELSGGQRQRVALLRTVLRPEPLVLLDEPFAGLDTHTRERAADWVKTTGRALHKTILLVTHQDEDVARISDRNMLLEQHK